MQRKRKRKKAVVVGEEASGSGKKVAAGVDIQSGVAFTVDLLLLGMVSRGALV